jgi:hypothetical protein
MLRRDILKSELFNKVEKSAPPPELLSSGSQSELFNKVEKSAPPPELLSFGSQ